MKQEQERATEDITEIAPNVLRTQLPIEMPGLGHVNCYLLEDERGVAIVDPGLPQRASYRALESRLKRAGYPLSRVHTVIVTHSHFDHFGGAAWVRAHSGADIVTHRAFRMTWDPTEPPDIDIEDPIDAALPDDPERALSGRFPWEHTPWGGPGITDVPWHRRAYFRLSRRFPQLRRTPTPTVRLSDAQTIRLARREWVAVHTPGHTDDHLCLFDPEGGVMLSGDHVLPTITPHIGGIGAAHDPLGMFFRSLDKVAEFGPQVTTVLPAHGHPFHNLAERAAEIRRHHDGRLDKVRAATAAEGHPMTVMEMSTHLFSPRAQGVMADSETFAHLEHLRLAGELARHRTDEGVFEYELVG